MQCQNIQSINGAENVGGIVGLENGGTISSCSNSGKIVGAGNLGRSYWVMWSEYTGTGGIAGKLYHCKVEKSYNTGNIESNMNVGGIAGLNWSSKVDYSYNSGNVTATKILGKVGGICGHGSNVDITACYNLGNISGDADVAGIMGSCVDNTIYEKIEKKKITNKYLGEFDISYIGTGKTHNYFRYCYNKGKTTGTFLNKGAGILKTRMLRRYKGKRSY